MQNEQYLSFLIGIGALFIIEQIFAYFLGSYPYRYGLLLHKLTISNCSRSLRQKGGTQSGCAITHNERRKEIYIRYRYPTLIIGPIIFVGQIKYENSSEVLIRIGPITALFIIFLVVFSTIHWDYYGVANIFIILGIIAFFYIRFHNMVKAVCSEKHKSGHPPF